MRKRSLTQDTNSYRFVWECLGRRIDRARQTTVTTSARHEATCHEKAECEGGDGGCRRRDPGVVYVPYARVSREKKDECSHKQDPRAFCVHNTAPNWTTTVNSNLKQVNLRQLSCKKHAPFPAKPTIFSCVWVIWRRAPNCGAYATYSVVRRAVELLLFFYLSRPVIVSTGCNVNNLNRILECRYAHSLIQN